MPELDDTKDTYEEKIKREEQEKIAQITSALAGPVGFVVIGMILLTLWYVPSAIDNVSDTYNYIIENGFTGAVDIFHDIVFGLVFWAGVICIMGGVAWIVSIIEMYR